MMRSDEISFEGRKFISARRAAEVTGYTRDYVGQLARSGKIKARRLGKGWFVDAGSLLEHKTEADTFVPTPPPLHTHTEHLDEVIAFDGNKYISVKRASEITLYNKDYLGQLARAGKIKARQVAGKWYLNKDDILKHKKEQTAQIAEQQVISSGLERIYQRNDSEGSPIPNEEIMTYSFDNRPLIPSLPAKKDTKVAILKENFRVSAPESERNKNEHQDNRSFKKDVLVYKNPSAIMKRPSMLLALPTAVFAALTIVVTGLVGVDSYSPRIQKVLPALVGEIFEHLPLELPDSFLSSHLRYDR